MFRLIKTLLLIVGVAMVLWLGAHAYARYRIRTGFAEAGMSESAAKCMGNRLVKRLSLAQLRKLEALQEEKHTLHGLVKAVRRMDDRKIVTVTTSSAVLCTTGLAR